MPILSKYFTGPSFHIINAPYKTKKSQAYLLKQSIELQLSFIPRILFQKLQLFLSLFKVFLADLHGGCSHVQVNCWNANSWHSPARKWKRNHIAWVLCKTRGETNMLLLKDIPNKCKTLNICTCTD